MSLIAAVVALVVTPGCGSNDDNEEVGGPTAVASGAATVPSAATGASGSPDPSVAPRSAQPARSAQSSRTAEAPRAGGPAAVPPAANLPFDYQIGGPYQPASDVRVVIRDRTVAVQSGLYNICYVNAFQTQPDAIEWWEKEQPDLLLRKDGNVVMDEEWGEALLDVSTEPKRTRLAQIVGEWIDDCGRRGFQAVEPDNLDSYSRSQGLLTLADDVAFARVLANRAHAAGLAIGQKNTVEMLDRRAEIGFDFAVAEECGRYEECGAYAEAFADRVLVIEYRRADFDTACTSWGNRLSIVLRDLDVTPPGDSEHVYANC